MSQNKQQNGDGEELGRPSCTTEIQMAFILSSLVTFLSGLLILLIFRIIWKAIKKWQNIKKTGSLLKLILPKKVSSKHLKQALHVHGVFHDQIEMLLSAQTFVGQVLGILVFVLSIGSLIIYFINSSDPVGSCSSYEDNTIPIDLTFNAFFTFYFGLRFLAASDKIRFWLEMNSIVDIFTIPPTFISCYLKSNWLGLRFLRALRLLELPQILQILRAIKSSNSVKLSKLVSIVLSTWFTAAGFIHLVENSGDPWLKGRNSQNISYFDSIYLVMATTSTVGFGDVVARTSLGRTFIMVFTLGSLILFANYIPELVELFANKKKYTSPYNVLKGKKFIVVCGNITVDSVTAFLRNFLRHKAGVIHTEIVFLGEALPSLELETIFKCYLAYATFVCGSALKWEDLRRVAVESAEACLIIANPLCSDSYAEDTSNIMRVLSIKNYNPSTRIIIQILQSHNKVFLPKIPSWNWTTGDNIICFAELKLGFIAQGCLVPGLCTFLTSLFVEENDKVVLKEPWKKIFLSGLKNKILTQRLSDDFTGMTFPEVSRLCFVKLHLLLIAVEQKCMFSCHSGLLLNPPAEFKLHKNTLGFFIAESARKVRRAFFYCATCHSDVHSPELIEKCNCKSKNSRYFTEAKIMIKINSLKKFPRTAMRDSVRSTTSNLSSATSLSVDKVQSEELLRALSLELPPHFREFYLQEFDPIFTVKNQEQSSQNYLHEVHDCLDSSGTFHWCKATPLDQVILKRMDKSKHEFENHIVACVFGDAHSALIGLRNFVMPLRASNYTRKELKDIVFVGSLDYLQREWRFLRNFPQVYILPGSALYAADLQAVNIEECAMCAVLSSPSTSSSSQTLVDTETIMATLNIGSLPMSCSDNPSPFLEQGISSYFNGCSGLSKYRKIPILTELKNPSNIHFIEQLGRMQGHLPGTSLHLSTSFATGAVFSGSFLDSLLATAFYNYHVLELVQMLVTGGMSSQIEQHLDKDQIHPRNESCTTVLSGKKRCKLGLLSLNQSIFLDIEPKKTFGQVFCALLDKFGILCLGLYRMIDDEKHHMEHRRGVCWFVITRPANEFKLLHSDLVFCAIPFNIYYKNDSLAYQGSYEITNIMPVTPEAPAHINCPPTMDPVGQRTTQPMNIPDCILKSKAISFSISKQSILTQNDELSVQTHQGETVRENGKEDMKEPSMESDRGEKDHVERCQFELETDLYKTKT
ncbi:potassium channel subfamily U member 1 [Saccopteryx bilineata]|uniref:potassium channel subfamily U member 1 n=1 Tax=Saccopteryx bilineata TaxID=59482 RepID=UPI00338D91FB